jgi:hypothetical protein
MSSAIHSQQVGPGRAPHRAGQMARRHVARQGMPREQVVGDISGTIAASPTVKRSEIANQMRLVLYRAWFSTDPTIGDTLTKTLPAPFARQVVWLVCGANDTVNGFRTL